MTDLRDSKRSFADGVQFAWDSTSISLAATCMRKYYYTMIRGIQPRNKSVHLIFGGIYASALELFYKKRFEGLSIDEALIEAVHHAMVESWEYEACSACEAQGCEACHEGKRSRGYPVDFADAKKTRVNLIRTIVWYIDQFAEETPDGIRTHALPSGKPAVELSFAFDLYDDVMLCGHLDRVVDYGDDVYIMDQKTTGGTIGPYFFEGFKPDIQMTVYTYAGQIVLGSTVRGVIIDGAQIAVNFTRFERGITTRSRGELTEGINSITSIIRHAQELTAQDNFPMNPTACGNYGGCPFRGICSRPPEVREKFIDGDFVEHNWDPIKAR